MSALVIVLTMRLRRGHRRTLERSLRMRAGELAVGDEQQSMMLSVLTSLGGVVPLGASRPMPAVAPPEPSVPPAAPAEPLAERIAALRSGDAARMRAALVDGPLDAATVPHAIPLLAWDEVAPAALAALRGVAASSVEPLVASLLSRDEEFAVRRRVPRVLELAGGPRVVEGLLGGLEDPRFEVRYRAGRALARVQARNPDEKIDRERIFAAVREAKLGRGVWESQRLLDSEDSDPERSVGFDDELLRERASRSLEHVFTLLSLASPRKPLVIAFRGLHTDDETLRGTALEYLESVLPPEIRTALWPYLEDRRPPVQRVTRPREVALEALMLSNPRIEMSLERFRRKA